MCHENVSDVHPCCTFHNYWAYHVLNSVKKNFVIFSLVYVICHENMLYVYPCMWHGYRAYMCWIVLNANLSSSAFTFLVVYKEFLKDNQPFNTETFSKAFVFDFFSVIVNVTLLLSTHLPRLYSSRMNNVKNVEIDLSIRTIPKHIQERCMELCSGFCVFLTFLVAGLMFYWQSLIKYKPFKRRNKFCCEPFVLF